MRRSRRPINDGTTAASRMGKRALISAAVALGIAMAIAIAVVYLVPEDKCEAGEVARFTPKGWVCEDKG